jgi:hypothetical protein
MAKANGAEIDRRIDHPAPPPFGEGRHHAGHLDWRKRMSDTIAYALLVYTGLQIFVTLGALQGDSHSLLPYFALIVLVAAIIPACRRLERRWSALSDSAAADPALGALYRRDRRGIWMLAIGLPFALTGLFWIFAQIFSA